MPAPASLPHLLPQIDFLALYKEGQPAKFFSLQELKGTEGQPRGEITFNKPPDLKEGDPRLPALPGNYIVKYQDGNTQEVKQEKKFAVQKCETSSPAEGGAKARAGDDSNVNGSVKAGDDSKTSDSKVAVEKPNGQAEARSAVGKKEESKPESDGKVGEKDAKAMPTAVKTDDASNVPPKDAVAKKDVPRTDESNAATSSAPGAGASMKVNDGESADQLGASNQPKPVGASAVEVQKVAATKASVVSAANQVAEGQILATSPSQQGAPAANEKELGKEEKKTEEKKTTAPSLPGGVLNASASLLGGVKTDMKPAEEKKLKEGGQAEASSVVDKKDGNKSESDGKGSVKEGVDFSKVVSEKEKKEGQSPGAGVKQVVKDVKDAPKTGGAENQQEATGKTEGAVNQPAEATMPGKKVDEVKKGADGGKDGSVKPDGDDKTSHSNDAVEKPKEGGQTEVSSAVGKKEESKPESDGKVGEKDAKAMPKAVKTDDASNVPPKDAVAKEASKAEMDKETSPSSSAMEKARKEALNKDWSQLEQDKVSAPTPASNPNSPEGKGPPGGQGRNGPGQVIDNEDDADEGGEWGGGSASVGKIAPMTLAQEQWLNGPRSKGALAGREEKGSAPSAPQGREPQGEKGKEKGASEGAPRPAEAQEKEDKEVRPQAVGSGEKDGSGEKEGKEGESKQDSTTKTKDSKTVLKLADDVGGDAHKKHTANKESTSKMQKAETDGSGKGAGIAAGGFAGLLAMAGMRLCFPLFICKG
jgi:hypothetical protein